MEEVGGKVAWGENVFDEGGEEVKRVFFGGHDEEEGGGEEVHALAVADCGVAEGVGREDLAELGGAGAEAEEDVGRESAGDVLFDLGESVRVGREGEEGLVVAGDAEGAGAGAFGPDLRILIKHETGRR